MIPHLKHGLGALKSASIAGVANPTSHRKLFYGYQDK